MLGLLLDKIKYMFFGVIYYKFFKLIEKYSKGGDEHCAYNALLFTLLILLSNLIVIYFAAGEVFYFGLTDSKIKAILLTVLPILLFTTYYFVIIKNKWREIISKVASSSYKGRKGNTFVFLYIFLSVFLVAGLVMYFLNRK